MKTIFKNIILWIYIKIHSVLINISIALHNTEEEILKADPNICNESGKKIQRMRHRNNVLEKFYVGQTDEKYVKEYYEILKKADRFMKNSTPHDFAVATDKHMRFMVDATDGNSHSFNLERGLDRANKKDAYGRRYEHYGFFDGKHKNAGKTLGEVIAQEFEERRTKDDDYEILYIFNNIPIEAGLSKIFDVVKKTDNMEFIPIELNVEKTETSEIHHVLEFEKQNVFELHDNLEKSKTFEFPIKVYREEGLDVVNKIEQLTEFLHVKKIGFEYRQLEFFIPIKFNTENIEENSEIFNEITNIKSIFVKNDYGELMGFGIIKFIKRIKYNDTHEVWKFQGIEMENTSLNR